MVVLAEEAQPSWCLTIFPGFVQADTSVTSLTDVVLLAKW
jgi:hypothetical protein